VYSVFVRRDQGSTRDVSFHSIRVDARHHFYRSGRLKSMLFKSALAVLKIFEQGRLSCRAHEVPHFEPSRLSWSRMKRTPATLVLFGPLVLFGSAIAFAQESKPLPYVAVHNPEFISAPAATFMNADDRVIGLMSGKTAKAYPAGILAQHGLVQDDSPSGPIAVTW
jgi:hypothetical protein